MTKPLPYDPSVDQDDSVMRDLAYRDALQSIRMDIPDPEEYAQRLPLNVVNALMGSYLHHDCWRVCGQYLEMLRPYSLIEARGPHLSAFGFAVRKVLLRWAQEERS